MSIDRFDVPDIVAEIMEVGIKHDLLDVKDVYALSNEFGYDWYALLNEIVEYAYVRVHGDDGESHAAIVKLVDKARKMELVPYEP